MFRCTFYTGKPKLQPPKKTVHLLSEVGFPQEGDLMQCGLKTGQMCLGNWMLSKSMCVTQQCSLVGLVADILI